MHAPVAPSGILHMMGHDVHMGFSSSALTEKTPSGQAIMKLVKKTYFKTQAAQLTISPEFTVCNLCQRTAKGLVSKCPYCSSRDLQGISRFDSTFIPDKPENKLDLNAFLGRHGEEIEEGTPSKVC